MVADVPHEVVGSDVVQVGFQVLQLESEAPRVVRW